MKKLLALILALVLVIGITACGKTEPATSEDNNTQLTEDVTPNTEETEEQPEEEKELPAEKPAEKPEEKPAEKPAEQKPAEQKPAEQKPAEKPAESPKTVGTQLLSVFKSNASGSTATVADAIIQKGNLPFMCMTTEVAPGLLNGFDNTEIKGFKSGTAFAPMIGSIAFIGYVFELEDGVSASDFIATLKSNANLRWNICVEADEMVTGASGNKVFFVMCPKEFEE